MTLKVHFLNVGKGSSAVVEYTNGTEKYFGVVDSNARVNTTPKAVTKLRALGAQELSFLCLTHPHDDHYSGMFEIISQFPRIRTFYSSDMGDLLANRERMKRLKKSLQALRDKSDATVRHATHELMQILHWADKNHAAGKIDWIPCSGEENGLAPYGFSGVQVMSIAPPRRAKGNIVAQIDRGDITVFGKPDLNEISMALQFEFAGTRIVLGGDATVNNWDIRRKYEANKNISVSAHAVNLPHHGSKYDCTTDVLNQLFAATGYRAAITSADGISHPDADVIKWLAKSDIEPFCTNLMPMCGAAVMMFMLPGYDPKLTRWLREVSGGPATAQPCQGDITVTIDPAGTVDVTPEHASACQFRGPFKALLSQIAP